MAITPPNKVTRADQQLTLSDIYSRLDPNGQMAQIAEVLTETNEVLLDMPYVEGNLPTGHRVSIRTGLPEAYWKQFNKGVPSSKSSTAQVEETCGMCQARSIIDKDELSFNGNSMAYRYSEDTAFVEALNQKMTNALFYCDYRKTKEGFLGFAPRYCTTDVKKADCAKNVIDCGGTGSNLTSIWIIGWGSNTIFGIYPKGYKGGLQVEDKGEQRVLDDNGNPYYAYETLFTWYNGLVVKDWRYAVRLCNIDVAELQKGATLGTGAYATNADTNLILKINNALAKIPSRGNVKIAMYMNGDVHALLNTISSRSNANVITVEQGLNAYGQHHTWNTFLGYPMRRVDQLKLNEAQVQ